MEIINRIILNNNIYYIKIETEYILNEYGHRLKMNNYRDDYYDGGDLSSLIKNIEEKYNSSLVYKKYGNKLMMLSDFMYIYNNIPFIVGIGNKYIDSNNNEISSCYMSKEELLKYAKENNIIFKDDSNFSLMDSRTWNVEI